MANRYAEFSTLQKYLQSYKYEFVHQITKKYHCSKDEHLLYT